ncbi:T-box protein 2 isoform X2 [Harpegnathos saltator]|uniref:Optomotor-blind protein n=2 Tax=Harpegnathos saltator TaxID=610380 RepID=E2B5Y9_HARSA|nr:T-box protein 2 isoform X2 [Harpegnathos saltator]EFN88958.1 Optomotor-blind protein [Harpegnathos saltator]
MIITKVGRRMFPHLQLNISGLQENLSYCIIVEMQPASQHRHKYCGVSTTVDENENRISNPGWTKAGQAESQPDIERRIYRHPDSPALGAHWMKHVVSFNKLKITNNADRVPNVLLTSMHKYIPRIWIFQSDNLSAFNELYFRPHSSFTFRETEFIAVTAYQNERITKLKIDNNPFAKGFRETGHSRYKRKLQDSDTGQMLIVDEDSLSSSEASPPPPKKTTAMMLRSTLHKDVSVGVLNEIKSPSSMIAQAENSTPRAEDNRENARPSTPSRHHRLYRPWLDPPLVRQPSLHLVPLMSELRPTPLSMFPPVPNLSLYNYRLPTSTILHHNFIPTPRQYHQYPYQHVPCVYPNTRDWHDTWYRLPMYSTLIN